MFIQDQSSSAEEPNGDHSGRALQRRVSRNIERALKFDDAMFAWRSRHLILIVTLTYKPHFQGLITLDDLRRDRDRLFNNERSNSLLQGINGCIWKLEEGASGGGLHMHLVIYYDGRCTRDMFYAEAICSYWKEIVTRGRGEAYPSNRDWAAFEQGPWGNATGQVDRHELAKREALRSYLVHYLCKEDQQVTSRTNLHCRMFGTSELPT